MRTNMVIDDVLMAQALDLSGYRTKKKTVEEALKLLICVKRQSVIRKYRGKLHWKGDLEKMRSDL